MCSIVQGAVYYSMQCSTVCSAVQCAEQYSLLYSIVYITVQCIVQYCTGQNWFKYSWPTPVPELPASSIYITNIYCLLFVNKTTEAVGSKATAEADF